MGADIGQGEWRERKLSGGKALRLGRCVNGGDFSRGRDARRKGRLFLFTVCWDWEISKMRALAGSQKGSFGDEDVGNSSNHYWYSLSTSQVPGTTPGTMYYMSVVSLNPLRATDAVSTVFSRHSIESRLRLSVSGIARFLTPPSRAQSSFSEGRFCAAFLGDISSQYFWLKQIIQELGSIICSKQSYLLSLWITKI